jgi:peroxiredoxin
LHSFSNFNIATNQEIKILIQMKTIILTLVIVLGMMNINAQETRSADEASGLPVGTEAPSFKAIDADGKQFELASALKNGPVVMIFYRGHWCPVCNKHLGAIQDSLQLIMDRGATVIAVSPQNPEYLNKMEEKSGATFRLLYDEGYAIADVYDVTFTPEKRELFVYNTALNAKLKESQSDDSQRLPIPATYIIDQDGIITWKQFDPNYKNRSSVKEIIANLPEQN